MSGSTPELALSTAVDSDDAADYLTLSLANSLRTVDGLFSSTTGHTHSGAHQGGAIGTIPAGSIPDGSITSAKLADGTIATTDLADRSVTNIKLGTDTARANLLTNGGFEIWQRGNGPFNVGGQYDADRWAHGPSGTDTMSVSRNTANKEVASQYCSAVTFTLGTGAGQSTVNQKVEDASQLQGRQITFSCRVWTSAVGSVRLAIHDGTWHFGTGNAQTTGYETLTFTWTVPSSVTAIFVGISFTASCTAYLDNAMLVVGSVPADYAPLHPADDLARCLRYYETMGKIGAEPIATAQAYSTTQAIVPLRWKVAKAATPVVTVVSAGNYWLTSATATNLVCTTLTSSTETADGARLSAAVASGLVAGNASILWPSASGTPILIEANP